MVRKPLKKSKITAWRKNVWLTVSACDRDLPDLAIDLSEMYEGIYLVEVYSPRQCDAISPNDVKDPWYAAIRRTFGRKERDISGYEMEVEAEARHLLSRSIKNFALQF